eukprot:CAMPEP_0119287968 /NCGR_PEP_ID=MMETSP1329-20130426/36451_1 /TAXON_ID=114041 /ORGANISM="Genus nov. species nov., Strain RCC1024" /LENGTH=199 /DNA_ID=CAMNT_0007288745 /DNA_START=313 /DNA_END=908 /DNA_ORIENTATION=-
MSVKAMVRKIEEGRAARAREEADARGRPTRGPSNGATMGAWAGSGLRGLRRKMAWAQELVPECFQQTASPIAFLRPDHYDAPIVAASRKMGVGQLWQEAASIGIMHLFLTGYVALEALGIVEDISSEAPAHMQEEFGVERIIRDAAFNTFATSLLKRAQTIEALKRKFMYAETGRRIISVWHEIFASNPWRSSTLGFDV